MESGIRMHMTEFNREKSMFPSSFCMKLRKHLKGKRLKEIQQLRADRIVDLTFGEGDAACELDSWTLKLASFCAKASASLLAHIREAGWLTLY